MLFLLPAHKTTFVGGASGSGKSTIAQLLLYLYTPAYRELCLDETDVTSLMRVRCVLY